MFKTNIRIFALITIIFIHIPLNSFAMNEEKDASHLVARMQSQVDTLKSERDTLQNSLQKTDILLRILFNQDITPTTFSFLRDVYNQKDERELKDQWSKVANKREISHIINNMRLRGRSSSPHSESVKIIGLLDTMHISEDLEDISFRDVSTQRTPHNLQENPNLQPSTQASTFKIRGENAILSFDFNQIPEQILRYCFEFEICMPKVWELEAPTISFPIGDLLWHLDTTPWDHNGQAFAIGPLNVIYNPEAYPSHIKRIQDADLSYPIDLSFNNGKWVIIDGLHRLCSYLLKGQREGVVKARIHSREAIISCMDTEVTDPKILKRYGFTIN